VDLAPALTPPWLYPRIVWGGMWGFLLVLPLFPVKLILRGITASLGPTIVQLFVVFPLKTSAGLLGFGLRTLTPLLVLLFNAVWGSTVALWLHMI